MIVNKKGMTLLELLVSVVLISVIMIFMYKLISDVRSEKKENDKLTTNLIKIGEIESKLQKMVIDHNLNRVGYNDYNNLKYIVFGIKRNISDHTIAWLYFLEEGVIELKIESTLSGIENETIKWSLEDSKFESACYEISENRDFLNYKIYLSNNNIIEIPIYSDEELSVSGNKCVDIE